MNHMNYEGKSLVFSFLFMTIYTDQKHSRNSRKIHKWLRASRNLCTLRQKHIPTRKPETHEKAILIASEPKFLVFWGMNSDQKSEASEKNPEMIASEPKFSHFRIGFFFFTPTIKPENQEKAIMIASEPKFLVFLGLKHTILLNILLINHMVCRYNKLCPCARKS